MFTHVGGALLLPVGTGLPYPDLSHPVPCRLAGQSSPLTLNDRRDAGYQTVVSQEAGTNPAVQEGDSP
jgi:hypothetical protein